MVYRDAANKLLDYIFITERNRQHILSMVSQISKGEVAVLIYLSDIKDGAYASELSTYLDINTSRVAAILNSLCKKGYIKRVYDTHDRRKVHVYLTDEGKTFTNQKRELITTHVVEILEYLGEDDANEYIRIMKKMSEYNGFVKGSR